MEMESKFLISIVIKIRMEKELKIVIVIEIRMKIEMEIMIEIVVVIVITGNRLMDSVILIPKQVTPSSYHQAFSDEAAF